MTDSTSFTFDEKTGELSRGGKVMALKYEHKMMFCALARVEDGVYVSTRTLAEAIEGTTTTVSHECHRLRARLSRIGLHIENKKHVGYRLVVNDMPKWELTIPPPATLESAGTTTECSLRESELVPRV